MFTLNRNYKWIDVLSQLVVDYNARAHQTIDMRPVDVTPAITEKLLATIYSAIKIANPAKFKVGDPVCVSKYKTVFEKGYTPNWTTEIFKIIKVQCTNPVTYLLEDYRGKSVAGVERKEYLKGRERELLFWYFGIFQLITLIYTCKYHNGRLPWSDLSNRSHFSKESGSFSLFTRVSTVSRN